MRLRRHANIPAPALYIAMICSFGFPRACTKRLFSLAPPSCRCFPFFSRTAKLRAAAYASAAPCPYVLAYIFSRNSHFAIIAAREFSTAREFSPRLGAPDASHRAIPSLESLAEAHPRYQPERSETRGRLVRRSIVPPGAFLPA